jgi:hypothetical protein
MNGAGRVAAPAVSVTVDVELEAKVAEASPPTAS